MNDELRSLRPLAAVDRRRFVAAGLAGGFAAATLPVSATTITTDSVGLEAGEVRIPVTGGELPGYLAKPVGGRKLPVVLVIQEIFGVHEHIRDVCRRFAKRGALAVAPELFARQGNPATMTDIQALMRDLVARVPDVQVMDDLDATRRWVARQGGDGPVGITGFCWGGRITWLYAAHAERLAAGVAWYGRLVGSPTSLQPRHPVDVVAEMRAPVLGLYGGRDGGIPLETVESMRTALSSSVASAPARASRIVVYPEAPHGFYADYRASYRPGDAQVAFSAAREWFGTHGLMLGA